MSRPKGSKDISKRKKRNQYGFGAKDAKIIKDLRDSHLNIRDISELTGYSETQIKSICRTFDIKTINPVFLSSKKIVDATTKRCGVYVIALHRNDGYVGYYVGSSTNIGERYNNHYSALINGNHYNKKMQEDFMQMKAIRCYIWSIEDEQNLLKEESKLIGQYCGLYNTWRNVMLNEISELLDIVSERFTEEKYDVHESGCWFWKKTHKNGYGRDLTIRHNEKVFHFKPHRISLFKYKGIYPELVRHKCNNRNCVCPHHLEGGSYKDNSNDRLQMLSEEIG